MNKGCTLFLLSVSGLMLLVVSPSAHAVTPSEMKACEMAVLSKSRFSDLPMAAVSVYPGSKSNHAHWTVRWDGLKADGNCVVNDRGRIKKVNVKKYKDGRRGNRDNYFDNDYDNDNNYDNDNDWEHSGDLNGFYYDRHVNQWRDPHGRKCYTCTPENGFPDHSRGGYDDWRPKNDFEQDMQKEMRNMLSNEDIENLNSLSDNYYGGD